MKTANSKAEYVLLWESYHQILSSQILSICHVSTQQCMLNRVSKSWFWECSAFIKHTLIESVGTGEIRYLHVYISIENEDILKHYGFIFREFRKHCQ